MTIQVPVKLDVDSFLKQWLAAATFEEIEQVIIDRSTPRTLLSEIRDYIEQQRQSSISSQIEMTQLDYLRKQSQLDQDEEQADAFAAEKESSELSGIQKVRASLNVEMEKYPKKINQLRHDSSLLESQKIKLMEEKALLDVYLQRIANIEQLSARNNELLSLIKELDVKINMVQFESRSRTPKAKIHEELFTVRMNYSAQEGAIVELNNQHQQKLIELKNLYAKIKTVEAALEQLKGDEPKLQKSINDLSILTQNDLLDLIIPPQLEALKNQLTTNQSEQARLQDLIPEQHNTLMQLEKSAQKLKQELDDKKPNFTSLKYQLESLNEAHLEAERQEQELLQLIKGRETLRQEEQANQRKIAELLQLADPFFKDNQIRMATKLSFQLTQLTEQIADKNHAIAQEQLHFNRLNEQNRINEEAALKIALLAEQRASREQARKIRASTPNSDFQRKISNTLLIQYQQDIKEQEALSCEKQRSYNQQVLTTLTPDYCIEAIRNLHDNRLTRILAWSDERKTIEKKHQELLSFMEESQRSLSQELEIESRYIEQELSNGMADIEQFISTTLNELQPKEQQVKLLQKALNKDVAELNQAKLRLMDNEAEYNKLIKEEEALNQTIASSQTQNKTRNKALNIAFWVSIGMIAATALTLSLLFLPAISPFMLLIGVGAALLAETVVAVTLKVVNVHLMKKQDQFAQVKREELALNKEAQARCKMEIDQSNIPDLEQMIELKNTELSQQKLILQRPKDEALVQVEKVYDKAHSFFSKQFIYTARDKASTAREVLNQEIQAYTQEVGQHARAMPR